MTKFQDTKSAPKDWSYLCTLTMMNYPHQKKKTNLGKLSIKEG